MINHHARSIVESMRGIARAVIGQFKKYLTGGI